MIEFTRSRTGNRKHEIVARSLIRGVCRRKQKARWRILEGLEDRVMLSATLQSQVSPELAAPPAGDNGPEVGFDLAPAIFSGWDDSLVISTVTGTNTDNSPITVADTVFVDLGWANFETDTVPANSFLVTLQLDGATLININTPFSLPQFSGAIFTDFNIGSLSAGPHTLTMIVDSANTITETNETNNIRERTFDVLAAGTEDFGDAPTAAQSGFASNYPTTLADNGARHTPLSGFTIGSQIDTEPDGFPSLGANLDDTLGVPDDEDGVNVIGTPSIGASSTIDVVVTNTAGVPNPYLDAWIDFNSDGDWSDAGEQVFSGAVVAGTSSINFSVPGSATAGVTYARFRLHDGTTGLPVTGLAPDGEVEDHAIAIAAPGFWVDQGPAPTENGQLEPGTQPNQRVTGATHTVVAHPTNADILYAGAVNGGIWKTTNATALNPTWTPQTDQLESLAIGAMAFDPTDATFNTLVAGTARYSSFAGFGGISGPVYRTADGGNNWVQLPGNGLRTVGENISGIAARGNTIVVTSSANFGGIFRSTDGGANFSPISSADFVSPNDNFTDLVADPSDATGQRLYAASEGTGGPGGIYRSDNFGATWTKITDATIHSGMHNLLTSSNNIEMATHPTTGRLYVAVLVSGQPRGVFHTNTGTSATPTWTQMDVPVLPFSTGAGTPITGATNATPIEVTSANHGLLTGHFVVIDGVTGNTNANGFHRITRTSASTFRLDGTTGNGAYSGGGTWTRVTGPNPRAKDIDETGAQGRIHFSIVVDPTSEDIVYIGGDRQDQPNAIGDNTFGGAIFRGDASITRNPNVAPSPQWDHITHDIVGFDPTGGTANGTATHADSREMTFDANGELIEVDDGGIFRRTSPRDNTGDWFSLAGTLGVIEFHDIAYDNISGIIMGGTQDNGTHFQQTPGGKVWDFLSGGDGGDVAVDNITLAGSGQSIRYSSSQNIGGFRRTVWDQNNNLVSTAFPSLTVTSGSPLAPAFVTPVELNAINPTRMVIQGSNHTYESLDQGATLTQVGTNVSNFFVNQNAIAYGGMQNNIANPDVLWVGSFSNVFFRSTAGALAPTASDPTNQTIHDLTIDPDDWATAFVIDQDQVFRTTNSGATWTDITGNLMSIAGASIQSITYVAGAMTDALVVGGNLGVFTMLTSAIGTWTEVGSNLPNVLVYDLDYNAADDVLVAGTLGRGAWTLPNASTTLTGEATADFGDAPAPYPVTLAENGARHLIGGPVLGANIDDELDGVHSPAADADDLTGVPDDEDGVTFGTLTAGQTGASVDVAVSGAGAGALLNAWIDFDGDGTWSAGERIADNLAVLDGVTPVTFNVPAGATVGATYARFRISTTAVADVTGEAADGEVEDHTLTINAAASDPPVVANLGSTNLYKEGRPPVLLAPNATVTDSDTPVMSGGSIEAVISASPQAGDTLSVIDFRLVTVAGSNVSVGGTLVGTVSAITNGISIALNSSATVANVQAILNAIAFSNNLDNLVAGPRDVTFTVADGTGATSAPVAKTVTVVADPDRPVIANLGGPATFVEDAGPISLTSTGTLSDPDEHADWSGAKLNVRVSRNLDSFDRLTIEDQGTGAGQISITGTTTGNVLYEGTQIGTWDGGVGTNRLQINFIAGSTTASIQALIRAIQFNNLIELPVVASKDIRFELTDPENFANLAIPNGLMIVNVQGTNDLPSLSGISATPSVYNEGGAPRTIGTGGIVTDDDYNGTGFLLVTIVAGGETSDRLTILNQGNGVNQIGVTSNQLRYSGVLIGMISGGVGTNPLQINFNANATRAGVQAAMRLVQYSNVSDNPSTVQRQFDFVLNDGDGADSNVVSAFVNVNATNDAPVLNNFGGDVATTTGTNVRVSTGFAVADPDSPDFAGGLFRATISSGQQAGDTLSLFNDATISVIGSTVFFSGANIGTLSTNATSLTVLLNSSATAAAVQRLGRNLEFGAASIGTRTVNYQVLDGDGGNVSTPGKNVNVS